MRSSKLRRALRCALLPVLVAAGLPTAAHACTRAVYFGQQGQTVTGRTMDWMEDMKSNLWVFPRGMARDGGLGERSIRWTSRYGSVAVSVYEAGTADGMNEQGLVANLLYLSESEYPPADDPRPALVISAWAQYALDNFATVSEAVAEMRQEKYRMVTVASPGGIKGNVHLSISDASGDSAILEYIGGRLVVHHGRQYQVMTNSPVYDEQLALNAYWRQVGGDVMLPGTNRPADRFVRASYYINATAQTADAREAIANVMSVLRNVSVPRGISTPSQPHVSSTLWRTVADQKNRVLVFEDTASPSLLWVRLQQLDFAPGSGVRKLALAGHPGLGGDQTANFVRAEPFRFLAPR